jgi:hypothetical protein
MGFSGGDEMKNKKKLSREEKEKKREKKRKKRWNDEVADDLMGAPNSNVASDLY